MKHYKLLSVLLLIIGVSGFSTYWLMYTAKGLSCYINWILAHNDSTIAIDSVNHASNGELTVKNFQYTTPKFDIKIDSFTAVWNPLFALTHNIEINKLTAHKLTIHTHNLAPRLDLSQYKFPIATQLATGSIKEIEYIDASGKSRLYKNVSFEQLNVYNELYVNYFGITTQQGHKFQFSGMIGLSGDSIVNLTTTAAFKVPVYQNYLHCSGTIVGSLSQLRFMQTIPSPFVTTIEGRVKNITNSPEFDINARIETSSNNKILSNLDLQLLSGNIFGKGTPDEFILEGNLNVVNNIQQHWQTSLASQVKNNRAQFNLISNMSDSIPESSINISGHWSLANTIEFPQTLSIDANWQNIFLPATQQKTLHSTKGSASFNGDTLITDITAQQLTIPDLDTAIQQLHLNSKRDIDNSISWRGTAITADGKVEFSAGLTRDNHQQFQFKNLNVSGSNASLVNKMQSASLALGIPVVKYESSNNLPIPLEMPNLNPLQKISGMINQFLLISQNSHATNPVQSTPFTPSYLSEID